MELWILVALGAGIAVQLSNISSELKFLSNKLNESKPPETSNLPKEIAEAIVWELDVNSKLAENIANEIKRSSLAEDIAHNTQYNGLPEKIAASIAFELTDFDGMQDKIISALEQNLGYQYETGAFGRAANLKGHLTSIESSLASIENSLGR
jgi:hypothetical protein